MTLKKTLIYSSLFLLSACAPALIYKTAWQGTPVVVDGKTNDWEVPLRFFDDKTKLSYSISNDDSMLYICVRATDADNIRGITHGGLQIWIDTTGKKGKQVGILFPYSPQKMEGGKHKGEGGSANNSGGADEDKSSPTSFMDLPDTMKENMMHRRYVENAKQMRVSGFLTIPTGIVELPDVYGISMGTNWDSYNVVVVEAAIPFRTFLKKAHVDASKILGITMGFTVKQKRMQTYGGRGGGGGRGMGGGMGGMGGGGYGGGGGGAGQVHAPVEETNEESVWAPFTLSLGK